MTSDFSSDPVPDNPFSSPQCDIARPSITPNTGNEMVCDGSGIDALKVGWDLMSYWFWPFLGYSLVCLFIRSPADHLENVASGAGEEAAVSVWLFAQAYDILIATPVSMGLSWVFLKAARSEIFSLSDIFGAFQRNYLHAVGAGLLKTILVVLGLLLLIVPGLYLLVKLAFVEYLIVDRKLGTIEALRESWRITDGREGPLFALLAMSVIIFLGGLVLCVVGVIPALIWLSATYAVLYHTYCRIDQRDRLEPTEEPGDLFEG